MIRCFRIGTGSCKHINELWVPKRVRNFWISCVTASFSSSSLQHELAIEQAGWLPSGESSRRGKAVCHVPSEILH